MSINVANSSGSGGYSLSAALQPTTRMWTVTDAMSASFSWYADGSTHTESLAGFETDHPTVQLRSVEVDVVNCSSSTADVWIDDLGIGINGTDTIYDFEPPKPDSLTVRTTPSTVVDGKSVVSSGILLSAGEPLGDRSVSLWARTPGIAYKKVESATTDDSGKFSSGRLRPAATTTYEWRHAADDEYATAASHPVTVRVARHVTFVLSPKTKLRHDAKEHVHGTVAPAKKGLKVTVFAARGHGRPQWVAHTTLDRRGHYAASFALPRGHYTLYVKTARDAKDLAGTSGVHALVVK